MDKIYLKDNYIVTELGGVIAVFPKNYSGYSENASGFYINSTFPVNNQRTIFIAFSDVGSIYDEAGVTAYTTDTLRTFLLSYTGFKSPSGGSGGVWGSITGTLSSQTDLQTALDAKQDDLISGTNIKTINSTSLLGSGDITVGSGITVGTTAVTSGTDGRVFFQSGGVVQQDSSFFWDNTNKRLGVGTSDTTSPSLGTAYTNVKAYRATGNSSITLGVGTNTWDVGNIGGIGLWGVYNNNVRFVVTNAGLFGIGTTSPQARLDVRAQGALSTDIAFRVRNSAETVTLAEIDGRGAYLQRSNSFTGTYTVNFSANNQLEFTHSGIGGFMRVGPSNTINFLGQRLIETGRGAQLGSTTIGAPHILNISGIAPQSSGVANTSGILLNYAINNTGTYVGVTRGIHYNPTLTSLIGTTHIAFENTTGDVLLNTTSGSTVIGATTAGARLDVRAQGALSTDVAFRVRNSADTANFLVVNGAGDVYNNGAGGVTTNTFYGEDVGRSATGATNSFFGFRTGRANTTGFQNSFFGSETGRSNTSGYYNSFFGYGAGYLNTTGNINSFFGWNSGYSNTTGVQNVFFGAQAGQYNTTGNNNVFLGVASGRLISVGTNLTIANNSVFLGTDTRPNADNQTNQIVIGHNAIGTGSNSVTLGNTSITQTNLRGQVVISGFASAPTGVEGAIYYDSTTKKHYGFDGTTWNALY